MKGAIQWGVILGVAVAVLTFVSAVLGWHRRYEMSFVFLAIAITLNVAAVVLCLRAGASEASWGSQVTKGAVLGLAASGIVFLSSWLVTTVVFPDYFSEMATGYRQAYIDMGLSDAEVADLVAATAGASPVRSALEGVVGTLVTSLIVAAVAGIWFRKKA